MLLSGDPLSYVQDAAQPGLPQLHVSVSVHDSVKSSIDLKLCRTNSNCVEPSHVKVSRA